MNISPPDFPEALYDRIRIHLPTEAEIQAEIRREIDQFSLDQSSGT